MVNNGLLSNYDTNGTLLQDALKKKQKSLSEDSYPATEDNDIGTPDTDANTTNSPTRMLWQESASYPDQESDTPNNGGTDAPTDVTPEYDKNGKRSWRIIHG